MLTESYQGDIALDDIFFNDGNCPTSGALFFLNLIVLNFDCHHDKFIKEISTPFLYCFGFPAVKYDHKTI